MSLSMHHGGTTEAVSNAIRNNPVRIFVVFFIAIVLLYIWVIVISGVFGSTASIRSHMAGQYNTSSVDQTGVGVNYQQRSD